MLRRVALVGSNIARGARALRVQQTRKMGGHGHDAHGHAPHKPAGPYDLPHHNAYPDEAYPFGLSPGKQTEGWEYITLLTYAGCFIALTFGMATKSNDSFTDWARREAIARESVKENGGEIEFGKYYQNAEYELSGDQGDAMPTILEK